MCSPKRMVELGARRIVFTDVSRKGMRGGVNYCRDIGAWPDKLKVPMIASGGVSGLDDLLRVKALEPIGVEGVVVVTAIYSGAISLRDAIAACC